MRSPIHTCFNSNSALPWHFEIRHLPGKSNHAADATSRHPSQSSTENNVSFGSPSFPDIAELVLMNTICNNTQELCAISWSPRDRDSCRCLFGPSPTISRARKTDCQQRPYPDKPLAHLRVSLCRRGRTPLPGLCRRPPIPMPQSLTESPCSP